MEALLAVLLPYIGSLLSAISWKTKDGRAGAYASLFIGLSFLTSLVLAIRFLTGGEPIHYILANAEWIGGPYGLYYDGLSIVMSILVSGLSFLIVLYSTYYMKHEYGYERYFLFFSFFVGSMMLVVTADNLLLLFIGWEGTGLASYALISHWFRDEEERYVGDLGRKALGEPMYFSPTHSGIRALMFTRLPDVAFAAGIFMIYLTTGTFNIVKLAESPDLFVSMLAEKGLLIPVLAMLTLGAMAKSAQFPLHEWLVTAMTGPTPVSALIHAAAMVKAGVYLMLRFIPIAAAGVNMLALEGGGTALLSSFQSFSLAVALIGSITAFMMSTMAIVARELKLILAYSTASQLGYMFAGIGVIGFVGEKTALVVAVVLAHLMAHAIFKAALFLGAGIILHSTHTRYIDEMPRLTPWLRKTLIAMWLATLSLAGIPPFIGFWSKEGIVGLLLEKGLTAAAVLAIVTIPITGFYSTRMLMFNKRYNKGEKELEEAPGYVLFTYGILGGLALVLGILWPFISEAYSSIVSRTVGLGGEVEEIVHVGATAIMGLSLALAGLFLSYASYYLAIIDTKRLASTLKPLTDFLYDRWYINPLIYKVFVKGGDMFATAVYKGVESTLDTAIHVRLTSAFKKLSILVRRLQTGDLSSYVSYLVAGFILALIIYMLS